MGLLGSIFGGGGGTTKIGKKASKELWDRTKAVADKPFVPYEGERVAAPTTGLLDAVSAANNAGKAGSGAISAAIDLAKQKAAYTPLSVAAPTVSASTMTGATVRPVQGILGATVAPVADVTGVDRSQVAAVGSTGLLDYNIDDYMNPYLRNVADSVKADLAFQREQQRAADNARAVKAGAFGGSRQAVVDAETNDMFNRTLGATVSDLYNRGYDTATGLIMQDANRKLQADQINQGSNVSLLGMDQQAKALNQDAAMKAALADAGYAQDAAKTNQAILMQGALADAGYAQQAGLANQEALNTASSTNAAAALEAARLNQAAGLTANQQGVTASGLLGEFGDSQNKAAISAAEASMKGNAILQTIEQAKADADYEAYLRAQGYDVDMIKLLQGSAGVAAGTRSGSSGGGILGGITDFFKGGSNSAAYGIFG